MTDILEINEFFSEGRDQEKSHVLLHITEPGTPEEKARGYFFALCEIGDGNIEQIEHLQQMIDDLESDYYTTSDEEDKTAFEIITEKVNRRGHHILGRQNTEINCLIGTIRGHELNFAYHGQPQATLFYKNNNQLEYIDIIDEENPEENLAEHLFPSVMQGKINSGDTFYVATPHTLEHFSNDQISKIILSKNNKQSANLLERTLKDIDSDMSFGGIFFHFTSPNLLTEKIEEEVLEETKPLQTNKKGHIETNYRELTNTKPEPLLNTILISLGKTLVWSIIGLFKFFKNILFFVGHSLVVLFILITNRGRQRAEIFRSWKLKWLEKKENFEKLPIISKILLFLTIILFVIFIVSLTAFKLQANYRAQKLAYNNTIQAITDKKNAAEASLIYGDTIRALTLLQEAQAILKDFPEDKNKPNLTKEVEDILQKVRKISTIKPEIIVDLAQINQEAITTQIAVIDNVLLAYGPQDKKFYKINPIEKTAIAKEHLGFISLQSATTPKENNTIFFGTDDNALASYSKDSESFIKKDISFPNENAKISTLAIYNLKLYTIDIINNKIYKHLPTQTGFDKGADWLKEDYDIKDSVSMAIDGDVFVLKNNGEVLKFAGGLKQEFNITGLDPLLDKPTTIKSFNGGSYIYILEPTNKRVVLLDKNGKLINQYTASEWTNPTGMAVDETAKNIFVLDSNKIYKFGF